MGAIHTEIFSVLSFGGTAATYIEVNTRKQTRAGDYTCINLLAKAAQLFIRQGYIKIGWVLCRVDEAVSVS